MVAGYYGQVDVRRPAPHRTRLRYDKLSALLVATGVTLFAFLAGTGAFGTVSHVGGPTAAAQHPALGAGQALHVAVAPQRAAIAVETSAVANPGDGKAAAAVPAGSGSGKRVVFDMSDQRVWLVGAKNQVERTYLVSGSVTDNLKPGRYHVYSRSLHAVGVDDSGTMQYFVRFTRGQNAAIGFHDIPVDQGRLVQTTAQLGTPQSHGCIRQYRPDAIRLWRFAPVGTQVSVVA